MKQSIHQIVDSTGVSIVGEGEWAAAKYGGRGKRAWKKLHIGIDESGLIVAEALTHGAKATRRPLLISLMGSRTTLQVLRRTQLMTRL